MPQSEPTNGYVYICEVRDLHLPVCKIGFTTRSPQERCTAINTGATGDFIWALAHEVFVNDCRHLERLLHDQLKPLRQKGREFFHVTPDAAYAVLKSTIESEPNLWEISQEAQESRPPASVASQKPKNESKYPIHFDPKYAEFLNSFLRILETKGRYFGKTSRPLFGVSDGTQGVQWNIVVHKDTGLIRVGVNLEGLKYHSWPIATFLLSERANPTIKNVVARLDRPDQVFVRFVRDAWQVTSRPNIRERYFVAEDPPISEVDLPLWRKMLDEALGCLDETKGFRGRRVQKVTLINAPKTGERIRDMEVSPHLNIWTAIDRGGDVDEEMRAAFRRLKPVHDWVSRLGQ